MTWGGGTFVSESEDDTRMSDIIKQDFNSPGSFQLHAKVGISKVELDCFRKDQRKRDANIYMTKNKITVPFVPKISKVRFQGIS